MNAEGVMLQMCRDQKAKGLGQSLSVAPMEDFRQGNNVEQVAAAKPQPKTLGGIVAVAITKQKRSTVYISNPDEFQK